MRVELFLALRLLRDARAQSVLIASGAAVGVAVIIFLTALISGLQRDLIARTVGSQAHLSVRPAVARPRPLLRTKAGLDAVVISRVEKTERQLRALDNSRAVMVRLRKLPGVRAATEICSGPARAMRGAGEANVLLTGVRLDGYQQIIDLRGRLRLGELTLPPRSALVGEGVAESLGLQAGDRLRVRARERDSAVLQVQGILRFGVARLDEATVLVPLRDAQALLGLPGGVTGIEVAVHDIYAAESIADALRRNTGLDVESWMQRNAELLSGLQSQSSSSAIIQIFVLLAVAIGIASVLIVSVVQRRKEIGILRAMGLKRHHVQRVFLIQGGLLGFAGALLGAGLGALLVLAFRHFAMHGAGTRAFPIELAPRLFASAGALAMATGVVSAMLPARRAANLDPAVAIRNE